MVGKKSAIDKYMQRVKAMNDDNLQINGRND
jgi:hypothetical protein